MLKIHNYPASLPIARNCSLTCDGQSIPIFELERTRFAHFAISAPVELQLRCGATVRSVAVRPQRLGVPFDTTGEMVTFHVQQAADLCIEIDRHPPLLLFIDDANTKQTNSAGDVIRFAAGRQHDVGNLQIKSGQSVLIEPGAIVRGILHAAKATDVTITGRGILDGGYVDGVTTSRERLVKIEACRNVLVEGITMIRPASWMVTLGDCDHAEVRNIRQLGEVVSSDGIDVVGSRHVDIHHCFLKNNDDCIAVKAIAGGDYGFMACDPAKDVFDVKVEHCAFWNDRAGNAMEIGFETRCQSISDITFRDIDVMGAHGHGGVFTIHNGDRALISRVLYEDIRIEHMFDRMIDFEIMHSRYSKDTQRGQIRDVTFRKIRALKDIYNTLNLIGGYDADHTVENIRFDDFQVGDVLIRSSDDLQIFTRHAKGIQFPGEPGISTVHGPV
jgi:hypothetical protein